MLRQCAISCAIMVKAVKKSIAVKSRNTNNSLLCFKNKLSEIKNSQGRFFTKAYDYYKVAVEALKSTGRVIENILFVETPNVLTPSKDYHDKVIKELIDENNILKRKVKELSASNDSTINTNRPSSTSSTAFKAADISIDEFGDDLTVYRVEEKKRRVSFGNDEVRTFNVVSDSAPSKEVEQTADKKVVDKKPVGWKPAPPPMPAQSATAAFVPPPPPPAVAEVIPVNPVRVNAFALQQVKLKKTANNENEPIKCNKIISSVDIKKVKLRNMIPLSRKETGKGASMQSAFKNALAAKFSHLRRDSTSSVKDDEDAEEWL